MTPTTQNDKFDRPAAERRYLDLVRIELPERAAAERWPIRFDHCLMRIVLDHVFESCWYDHLDRRRPAYVQLTDAQLQDAIALALRMQEMDRAEVRALNQQSLTWRGKRTRAT